ncbi:peptide chain release factor N(5)-glutamine methyltransferase [Oculatella sp. LEGE 06141]|uniref:peptide chain release factor N(5)-glutamine methyltransferase n=1 Tax=Oculatella sp. LEGE 06141 TaxID=1828648 RepID=UPI00188072FA|nr:peptide chain release factor N(5)-glutamine methyltransferase [Oculatella sp. LEGE 06141]MBE9182715.1 peptide chain release factor N(5)-glutamine methyltransferase [Oculatella sp. LEGE 06141]
MATVSGVELWQWRLAARQQAIEADVPVAEVDWLLQDIAGLDRLALRFDLFKDRRAIDLRIALSELNQLWQQRLQQRVPIQYLAGTTPWRQFSLTVSPAVLIPRPETESLIDLAIAATQPNLSLRDGQWVDLGTGSGAIALGLAATFPNAVVHAVDTSAEALAIAQTNARQMGFESQIQFHQGSWFQPLEPPGQLLSGVVSNPPYIPSAWLPDLQPEVTLHEPHLALDGGTDGLDCIRELVTTAPAYLISGGVWLIEMMAGQSAAVVELLQAQGHYRDIQVHPDLAGIARFALAYRV